MISTAYVNIWGVRVGAIAWDNAARIGLFEYDAAFIEQGWDLAPLKMPVVEAAGAIFSFPELNSISTFRGLPGLLADIMPDKYGNALINSWLNKNGRPSDSLNPVEVLCFIGERGMGAIEIEPAIPKNPARATKLEIEDLVNVAENILTGRQEFSTNISKTDEKAYFDILKIGTSAGGARAKAVIAYNKKTGEVRSGQTIAPKGFEHWLIKFDGVIDKQFGASNGYGRVEMAYYLMAKDAGIVISESALLEENGRAHFMTKRFDRNEADGKLHVQTFCAMQHYDFNEVSLYSYEQLFETMRLLGLPYPDADQLFRRMVFNVMARNCDDHTKNFAFIMDKSGIWRLAPAYDICHAYRPGSDWVSQHVLSVNGKRTQITRNDLVEVAMQMNIKKPKQIIELVAATVKNWSLYAKQVNVNKDLATAIEKTLWLF
ncbi:MAG: type II toxin-antitoxin system HipA family toxin [Salinivirgaceae bacterium]|nr:type II toxin-antitoxin system HipA family toxin [Salinivirgaceae bacterium]